MPAILHRGSVTEEIDHNSIHSTGLLEAHPDGIGSRWYCSLPALCTAMGIGSKGNVIFCDESLLLEPIALWSRELTKVERLELRINPYQIFKKIELMKGEVFSVLKGKVKGISNKEYLATVSRSNGLRLCRQQVSFMNEDYEIYVPAQAGETVYGYISDNNTEHDKGAFISGVTQ